MKTTKRLLILCLALFMGILCMLPSTFSWYTHNGQKKGNAVGYSRGEYSKDSNGNPLNAGIPISNGDGITMQTYRGVYNETTKEYDYTTEVNGAGTKTFTVPATTTVRYKTTITNASETDAQRVGLFLEGNSHPDDKVRIGVDEPMWNYERTGPVNIRVYPNDGANSTKTRIFFQPRSVDYTTLWSSGREYWVVCCKPNAADNVIQKMTYLMDDPTYGIPTYCVDIPSDIKNIYFTNVENINAGGGNRSATIDVQEDLATAAKGLVYYYTGTSGNAKFGHSGDVESATIKNYVGNITLNIGDKNDIHLTKDVDYTGEDNSTTNWKSIKYEIVDGGGSVVNLTENADGAVIVEGKQEGTAQIRITATGAFGDTVTAFTNVTVAKTPELVVRNVKIPAIAKDSGNNPIEGSNVVDVYWYIENNTDTEVTFDGLMLAL